MFRAYLGNFGENILRTTKKLPASAPMFQQMINRPDKG